jgi:transglutaminase-like putative cysteine protease
MRYPAWILMVLLLIEFRPVFAFTDLTSETPPEYREQVLESLQLAGENRSELEKFLSDVDDAHFDMACFIVANMPYRDLGVATASVLLENLQFAVMAQDSLPWGPNIPNDLFLHYVLPYRESQERLSSWRPFFFEHLFDRVRACTSMTEAALAVNRWLDEETSFEPTERRDQGPVTTVLRGIGRCEELTIAYIAAARSVGLPARKCWTPWWSLSDNNHAWAEVWADGRWHYLGAAEARDQLDDAWFTRPVEHAAAVYSTCYGRWQGTGEPVYKTGDRYTIINSISVYTESCSLAVEVLDAPAEGVNISVNVFNWGWLRPVAEQDADSTGSASFVVGPGDYLVTGGTDSLGFWRHITATPESTVTITASLTSHRAPQGFVFLETLP